MYKADLYYQKGLYKYIQVLAVWDFSFTASISNILFLQYWFLSLLCGILYHALPKWKCSLSNNDTDNNMLLGYTQVSKSYLFHIPSDYAHLNL
jgi:hypothetical protein